jgi:uncharacterized membrane protein
MPLSAIVRVFFGRLSLPGLVLAIAFFCASLTPSLMPREALVQGALSGVAAAVGYLIGVSLASLWFFLELPTPRLQRRHGLIAVTAIGVPAALVALWQAAVWQNSTRALWQMEPLATIDPLEGVLVALVLLMALIWIGRLFMMLFRKLATRMATILPTRFATLVGFAVAALIFWSIGENIVLRGALRLADSSFQQLDDLMEDQIAAPTSSSKTGGPDSRLAWHGLGRQGRHYVASGPTRADIERVWGKSAMEPVRVYAGLNNADDIETRVALALEELIRQGGFERSTLVIVTPTGTGWIDPAAADTLDVLLRGDVASVALQYSYLSSWLSLLVEPEYGSESAKALFRAVYRHWKQLPVDKRPRLVLYGLSLGALNSQSSVDLLEIVADPFYGALWVGPSFQSRMWNEFTADREAGSPAWLPRYGDGSIVRFTNQRTDLNSSYAEWGPLRIVYLQYASDPVVFFDARSAYRSPEWLSGARGPDVSPELTWYPVLTMLQLLFDMMIATTGPIGYGHVYAPQHHIDPWIAVTGIEIDEADVRRLKDYFSEVAKSY